MTTPNDPNAPQWNAPAVPPAEAAEAAEPAAPAPPPAFPAPGYAPQPYGQPPASFDQMSPAPQGQYGQPPQGQYGQPPQGQYGAYPQTGYPQAGYPAASMGGIPGSVKTVSVLMFIGGGFGVLASLGLIFGGAVASSVTGVKAISAIAVVIGVLILALSGLEILIGLKIRSGVSWARTTAIVLTGLSALFQLGTIGRSSSNFLGIVLSALILYFLLLEPKAKAFFDAHK